MVKGNFVIKWRFTCVLTVVGWNDITVFITGQCHDPVHIIKCFLIEADTIQYLGRVDSINGTGTHIGTHGDHALQTFNDRLFFTGGQQVGQILDRNT